VDLELEIAQLKQDASKATKELQSLKEILVRKEADFVEEITLREERLQELEEKLQQSETELYNLQ